MGRDSYSKVASRRLRDWRIQVPFWGAILAVATLPALAVSLWTGTAASVRQVFLANVALCLLWAAATPGILGLSHLFFIVGRHRLWCLAIHAVASAAIAMLVILVFAPIAPALGDPAGGLPPGERVGALLLEHFRPTVLYYWLLLLAHHLLAFRSRFRQERANASQTYAQLTRARLNALQNRLNPHFLFNTLHTVGGLVRLGRQTPALETLEELGALLRQALDRAREPYVPLSEELDFIAKYLNIECRRFSDRLRVSYDVEPQSRTAEVPALLLQPLVENAVQHGIARSPGGGSIILTARREDDQLYLEVADDGPGLSREEAGRPEGIGLRTTRDRLAELYAGHHRFEIRDRQPHGVTARVWIPWRKARNHATGHPHSDSGR